MIIGLQITALIFAFSMIYIAVLHFKRREISLTEILVWLLVWCFVIVAIVFPDLLQTFAKTFRFARLFDMMVVGAFLLVIAMTVKVYVSTRKMERIIEEMVRKDTLNSTNPRKKK